MAKISGATRHTVRSLPKQGAEVERILLVQPSFIGDLILSTPLLAPLRDLHPGAEIWVLTTALAAPLLAADPWITGVITFDKNGIDRGVRGLWRLIQQIRRLKFAKAYILQRHLRSSLIAFLGGIPKRRGFAEATGSFLYNERVPRLRAHGSHEIERNLSLLAGLPVTPSAELRLVVPELERISSERRELLQKVAGSILFAPGSVWATKRWAVRGWSTLLQQLVGSGERVALVGSAADRSRCQEIDPGRLATDLAGELSFAELLVVVSSARAVISNDSMMVHLASALKKPVVAIFCSTVPEFGFTPWRTAAMSVGRDDLDCRPCGRHGHHSCPLGTNLCMEGLGADKVLQALNQVMLR